MFFGVKHKTVPVIGGGYVLVELEQFIAKFQFADKNLVHKG